MLIKAILKVESLSTERSQDVTNIDKSKGKFSSTIGTGNYWEVKCEKYMQQNINCSCLINYLPSRGVCVCVCVKKLILHKDLIYIFNNYL